MTTIWNVHQPGYYLGLTNVLRNATITESDADHVVYTSSHGEVALYGSFTGSPAAGGSIESLRLTLDGTPTLDVDGFQLSLADFKQTVLDLVSDNRPFEALILSEAAVIKGSAAGEELVGGAFDDTLIGRGGDDDLFGEGGGDLLKGGKGNDRLDGGDGKDVLKGGADDDVLSGGKDHDTLVGGGGHDTFAFSETFLNGASQTFLKGDSDRIVTFKPGTDSIGLYLVANQSDAPLAKGQFHTGNKAHDGDDLVIYDRKSGALFLDSDGDGAAAQVKFAKVDPGLKLTHHDFDLLALG